LFAVNRTVEWQALTDSEFITPVLPRGPEKDNDNIYIYSYYCFCPVMVTKAKRCSKAIGMRTTTQTYYFAIRAYGLKYFEDKPVE
jgi:hypothetical protein